jgi:hypothetical protein
MLARTGSVLSMHMVMRSMLLLLVLLTSSGVLSFDFLSWERESGVRETSYRDLQDLPQFLGNQTHRDYFKLLKQDGLSVLVGARNMVYNLSLPDLIENEQEVISSFVIERYTANLLVHKKSKDYLTEL